MTAVTRLAFFILNIELLTMPSGSSSRYQSKIFNFVHQQSRRLTEQFEHTVRYVQVATKRGVGVLLYPIYRLLHTSQSSERTLYSKESQTRLKLEPGTPPSADAAIENILETVKNLPFAEVTTKPANTLTFFESLWSKVVRRQPSNNTYVAPLTIVENPAPTYATVRGIATNLENRNLLLITGDNQILDILTSQQQEKLEELIITEVAKYWRSWRLLQVKKQTNLLPEIERLLIKLTGGQPEPSPALNSAKETPELDISQYLPTAAALAFLDKFIANLESNALVPIQQRSRDIIQVAQTQLSIFLYGKEQLAARGQIIVNGDGLETQTLNIPALLEAALNYFFGVGNVKNIDTRETNRKLPGKRLHLSSNSQLTEEAGNPDSWLTWDDLYGNVETSAAQPVTSSPQANSVIDSSSSPSSASKNSPNKSQNFFQSTKVNHKGTKKQKASQKTTKVTPIKSQRDSQREAFPNYQYKQLEAQPDWIETKATLVGYEKHILQQILEVLDMIVLWIETIFVNMIMFLRGLLGVK
jgi:hypothetical protein